MSYPIQSFDKTETYKHTINSISVSVFDMILGVSAKILTQYYDNGRGVYITEDILTGDDYNNWGSDDDYIINWICQKYNLSLV